MSRWPRMVIESCLFIVSFITLSGHPQKAYGKGLIGAAHPDWCSLWAKEEGWGRTYWSHGADCEITFCLLSRFKISLECKWDSINRLKFCLQENRRAERAEIQRVRAEKEKDRQNRIAVKDLHFCIKLLSIPAQELNHEQCLGEVCIPLFPVMLCYNNTLQCYWVIGFLC